MTNKIQTNRVKISIIVPTFNSSSNLSNLLKSLTKSSNKQFELIINDDRRTSDNTADVVKKFKNRKLNLKYIQENVSMAQARKSGANFAKGSILLHLDSDMEVSEGLIGECISMIEEGWDALIIPEESFGTTFWAKCKWLEKKCYEGIAEIESLRCIKRSVYDKLGGHNEKMIFSEDKDLDLRVRKQGCKVGRTSRFLKHNEGKLVLRKTIFKKKAYSSTANIFAENHPDHFKWQSNVFKRYQIYFKNYRYLFSHPLLYTGLFILKTCEFAAGGIGYISERPRRG